MTKQNISKQSKTGQEQYRLKRIKRSDGKNFNEILHRPPPIQEHGISDPEYELNINAEPPQIPEIESTIKSLNNEKTPGSDNLNTELFKADPRLPSAILQPIFHDIWKNITIPDEWNYEVFVKIPKKGNLNDYNIWRDIILLSILSTIMAKI